MPPSAAEARPDEPGAGRRRDGARASIYDVAAVAGVSHQTVSRVLNEHPHIRPETRDRVLKAIAEVNYTRNSIARALATRRTMRIGVLVDSSLQHGPNSTLRGVEAAAREAGYSVLAVSVDDPSRHDFAAGVAQLATEGVDALCVVAPRSSSLEALRAAPPTVPTVVIASEEDPDLLMVAVDQHAGARAAVAHLVALGHREIRHLAGPLDWLDARERKRGWRSALAEAGLRAADPVVGDWTSDSGYDYALTSAALEGATAVFAANDQMALGVVHGLRDRGLRVPEDVSVVGFDDVPDARHFSPPLTTVRQDFPALGARSMASLLAALDGAEPVAGGLIAAELIVRDSSGPPPG